MARSLVSTRSIASSTGFIGLTCAFSSLVGAQRWRLDLPRSDMDVVDDSESVTFTAWIWILMVSLAGATSILFSILIFWNFYRERERKKPSDVDDEPEKNLVKRQDEVTVDLQEFTTDGFVLVPQFSPGVKSYSAWVDEGVKNIKFSATPSVGGIPADLHLEKDVSMEVKCSQSNSRKIQKFTLSSGIPSGGIPVPKVSDPGSLRELEGVDTGSRRASLDTLLSIEIILKLGTPLETAMRKEQRGESYNLLYWTSDNSINHGKVIPELSQESRDRFVVETDGRIEEVRADAVIFCLQKYNVHVHRRLNLQRLPTRSGKGKAVAQEQQDFQNKTKNEPASKGEASAVAPALHKPRTPAQTPPPTRPTIPQRMESIVKKDLRGGKPFPYTEKNVASKFQ